MSCGPMLSVSSKLWPLPPSAATVMWRGRRLPLKVSSSFWAPAQIVIDRTVTGCLNVTWIHCPASLPLPSRHDVVVSSSIASLGAQMSPSLEDAIGEVGFNRTVLGPLGAEAVGPGDGLDDANRPPRISAA